MVTSNGLGRPGTEIRNVELAGGSPVGSEGAPVGEADGEVLSWAPAAVSWLDRSAEPQPESRTTAAAKATRGRIMLIGRTRQRIGSGMCSR